MKRIAIMTSGGDAPGMNAFIRAATRHALDQGLEVYGVYQGYQGMIENQIRLLPREKTINIIQRGGTILKTSRSKEFLTTEGREKAARNLEAHKIDGLICCGGNGSYAGLIAFSEQWSGKMIGAPGTIDNDVTGTEFTIGFDTAVNTAVQAIDHLRDTGDSHSMHFIVEVMGRHCGDIATAVGKASGAESVLIPETVSDLNAIYRDIQTQGHNIVVVAEGDELGGAYEVAAKLKTKFSDENLNAKIRVCVLGHIQRGGSPSARDRILAHEMGVEAVDALIKGESLKAIGVQNGNYILGPLI